ncbi:MAG: DUF1456 family protein [Hungatella sp.]|nr:DUF1456 family protein [Hungatella sp.]MDR2023686.1 DUF1456 family protein [Hungatella sp.]
MDNNDILIRLRYAMDIKDSDMVEIFKLGGIKTTKEGIRRLLTKPQADTGLSGEEKAIADKNRDICNDFMLESFLNGYIIFKRGKQESKPGEPEKPLFMVKDHRSVNNVLLKKVKIALSLTGDDMLAIFKSVGINLSNGELSALLRREGQRNYKECQDRYIRNFLKGLAIKYRSDQ